MRNAPSKDRFERLRARCLAAVEKREAFDLALRRTYGPNAHDSWLRAPQKKKVEQLREAESREWKKFYAYLSEISPRDWGYGVPVSWLRDDLTFDDAVRPCNEALSVVPPLSYGATTHRT